MVPLGEVDTLANKLLALVNSLRPVDDPDYFFFEIKCRHESGDLTYGPIKQIQQVPLTLFTVQGLPKKYFQISLTP